MNLANRGVGLPGRELLGVPKVLYQVVVDLATGSCVMPISMRVEFAQVAAARSAAGLNVTPPV